MRRLIGLVLLWLISTAASAHKASDSYLTLSVKGATIDGHIDIALRDLDYVLGLGTRGDGSITWGDVKAKSNDISHYVLTGLQLRRSGTPCVATSGASMVDAHSDGVYDVVPIRFECPTSVGALRVDYNLFFDVDPTHRGLSKVVNGASVVSLVFSPETRTQQLSLSDTGFWRPLAAYVNLGIRHILSGADHLLFLFSLIIASVAPLRKGTGSPVAVRGDLRSTLWSIGRTVTAFSAAHSITLALGFFDVVHPPARWVESGIALSVMVASANNIVRVMPVGEAVTAFVFGLVHGLGFANSLSDLALSAGSRVCALAGFNVGVELGQLFVVALVVPLLFIARGASFYRRVVVVGGSLAICAVATSWFAERAFDVSLSGYVDRALAVFSTASNGNA
jgi:hypothetical protein